MPKIIKVTRAEVMAAQLLLRLAERGFYEATPAVHVLANAKPARRDDDRSESEAAAQAS